MQQRYYDPVAGRFLSTDPVLTDVNTAASFNRYTYALNNPYKYIDPDGRDAGDPFKTARAAAIDVIKTINPQSKKENKEYGGKIYKDKDGSYKATKPVTHAEGGFQPSAVNVPKDAKAVGDFHTHGEYSIKDKKTGEVTVTADPKRDNRDSDNFSDKDKAGIWNDSGNNSEYKGYLGTPSGKIREFDPSTGQDKVIK
ncbi:DUF4329 domain-containing protein [Undibacterium sp. LX15W]|uniref:DUF4329 domain-containing protein n=2 Tax=Undibacterium flavidum TaxID=2762297 RepID=A0ABR6YEH1_9BURK|nr:DUF4329 domain-containing protein [Undibacterium flavidum]